MKMSHERRAVRVVVPVTGCATRALALALRVAGIAAPGSPLDPVPVAA